MEIVVQNCHDMMKEKCTPTNITYVLLMLVEKLYNFSFLGNNCWLYHSDNISIIIMVFI